MKNRGISVKVITSDSQKPIYCQYCVSPTREIKGQLIYLRNILLKKKFQLQDQNWNQTYSKNKSHLQEFARLFHVLVGHQGDTSCRHQKLYNKYFRKIKGSHSLLAQFFEKTAEEIGFKNFQIDLLAGEFDKIGARISNSIQEKITSDSNKTPQHQKGGKTSKHQKSTSKIHQEKINIKIQQNCEQTQNKFISPSPKDSAIKEFNPVYCFPFYCEPTNPAGFLPIFPFSSP